MVNINKIYELAKERGIKLSYICTKLDLTRTYFSDVRRNNAEIPEDRIIIIADLLDTTPEYLKDETEQKEKPIFDSEDERAVKLNKIIKDFSPEQLEQVLDYVRFVALKKEK